MQLPWSAELKPRSVVLFLILLSVRAMSENLLNALCLYFIYSIKETARRSQKGQVKLVLLWSFAECGNRKALRVKAQGVYSCK